jgi:hypothetical protein
MKRVLQRVEPTFCKELGSPEIERGFGDADLKVFEKKKHGLNQVEDELLL